MAVAISQRPILAVAAVTGSAVLLAMTVAPEFGAAVCLILLPLSTASNYAGLGSRTAFEIALGLMGLAAVVRFGVMARASHLRGPLLWPEQRFIVFSVVAWLVAVVLEFLRDPRVDLDETVLNSPGKVLYRVVVGAAIFFLVALAGRLRHKLSWLALAFAVSAVIPDFWAVLLYTSQTFVPSYDGGLISEPAFDGSVWRVGSTFNGPFGLAYHASVVFCLALAYAFRGRGPLRVAAVSLGLITGGAVLASQVRAGTLAVGLAVAILVLVQGQHRIVPRVALLLVGGTGAIALALALGADIFGRLLSFDDTSTRTRVALWQFASEMFVRSPTVGWGLSSFERLYEQLYSSVLQVGRISAHSTLFSVAVDMGTLGLVLLAAQIVSAGRVIVRLLRDEGTWLSLWLAMGVVASIPFLLTEDIYVQRDMTYTFYAFLGFCAAAAAGLKRSD